MLAAPAAQPASFAAVVPTVYGQVIVNRNDINQTNALFKTGRAIDHADIQLLGQVLRLFGGDLVVVDIGANFGTYALGLAQLVGPRGKVHAFEPQRLIFNMLAGSVALNSLTNVYCYNMAVGDHEGSIEIPQFDYSQPLNFGSIEFGPSQREPLTQERRHCAERVEYVPLTTLDHFGYEQVDLIKIDTEGMELAVLDGARETIARCRPVMYVEYLKVDRDELRRRLLDLNYLVYENNINFLCVPAEKGNQIRVTVSRPS